MTRKWVVVASLLVVSGLKALDRALARTTDTRAELGRWWNEL